MTGIPSKTDHFADHHHDPDLAHKGADLHDHGSSEKDTSTAHKLKERIEHPFPHLREKLKHTHLYDAKVKASHLKHKLGKLGNLVNRNHRHDEEHEKVTDEKRTKIAQSHRFESFAPARDGNDVKWYVDGRDYFWAISVALDRAKETIYIEDWWLSPELVSFSQSLKGPASH
jgi:phosphatidylserine/phosphatidylglycerophosphate/cardiolipin synthase-like enzyme